MSSRLWQLWLERYALLPCVEIPVRVDLASACLPVVGGGRAADAEVEVRRGIAGVSALPRQSE